jgi:hypothetical protein
MFAAEMKTTPTIAALLALRLRRLLRLIQAVG